MKLSWRTEWPLWLLIAAMFALAIWSWGAAPGRMPVHWSLAGRPDRWGGKFEGLMLVPCLGAGLYLLFLLAPRIDPGRANYATFSGAYLTVRLLVMLVMTAIEACLALIARGHAVNMAGTLPVVLGALFVGVGNLLGKVRPNWTMGIRTPWTLSSKDSWTRTHRAGAWVLVLFGVLCMAGAWVRSPWYMPATFAVLAIGVAGLAVYSYVVWKRDPDKIPPAGTLPGDP